MISGMGRLPFVLVATSFVVTALLACNDDDGTVDASCAEAECRPPPGGSTGDAGAAVDGSDPAGCSVLDARGKNACVPGTAKANRATSIDVRLADCLACATTVQPCEVTTNANVVTLAFATRQCPPPDGVCPAVCAEGKVTCAIPPLAAGTYQIVLEGEPPSTGLPPRELVISDDASATSCELLPEGTTADELSVDGLATSCVIDTDCAAVRTGDPCAVCACPNAAIATSELPFYGYQARPLTAACARPESPPACAPCPTTTATCVAGTCQLTSL